MGKISFFEMLSSSSGSLNHEFGIPWKADGCQKQLDGWVSLKVVHTCHAHSDVWEWTVG